MESDVPPALVPGGLVANRMLEEDPPRYTRASDPCEPCVMGKHGSMHFQKQMMLPYFCILEDVNLLIDMNICDVTW